MLLKFKNLKLSYFSLDEVDGTGTYELSNGNCTVNLVSTNLGYKFDSKYELTLQSDLPDDETNFNVVGCVVVTDSKAYLSLKSFKNDIDRAEINFMSVTAVEEVRKCMEVNLPVYFEIKSV